MTQAEAEAQLNRIVIEMHAACVAHKAEMRRLTDEILAIRDQLQRSEAERGHGATIKTEVSSE
jgi:uncharacterized coiled-coil protein SlyX